MNIQKSSSARSDTGNPGSSVNENLKKMSGKMKWKKIYWKIKTVDHWKKVYTNMKFLENWRKALLFACVAALSIDPLFLFIPEISSPQSCFTFDKNLGKTVSALRTFIDTFYLIHIIYYFIHVLIVYLDGDRNSSRGGESNVHSKAQNKSSLLFFLIVDIVSVLPIPQVVVLSLIVRDSSSVVVSKSKLISFIKWIIVCQYIPRIVRIYPIYKNVTRTSGTIAESNWIGAALNLFLFMLFSYVFGAFWYVSAIDKKSKCWREKCEQTIGCAPRNLFCQRINNTPFLNNSCPFIDPEDITTSFKQSISNTISNTTKVFDFGMYIEVLKSGVVEKEPKDFPRKFVYCFWWGLRNLSTFAQSLKPGNSATDMFFAILICVSGLFLFAVLIGNVQKYMMSTTVRVEEMKEKRRDAEKWMSSRDLPEDLQERIRKYEDYKWREFRGVEEGDLLGSLPKDLRLETKRYLYFDLLKKVSLLENIDDRLLEALCDRAKSVFYSANSCIVREGDPVEEMLIVTKGELEYKTKSNKTFKLRRGDVCGDLHFWILNPTPSPQIPISDKTVTTVTDVEGFILLPDDLNFVASHLDHETKLVFEDLFRKRQSECSSSSKPQRSADSEISKDSV